MTELTNKELEQIFKQPTELIVSNEVNNLLNNQTQSNQTGGSKHKNEYTELSTIGFNMNTLTDDGAVSQSDQVINQINNLIKQAGGNFDEEEEPEVDEQNGGRHSKHDELTTLNMGESDGSYSDSSSENSYKVHKTQKSSKYADDDESSILNLIEQHGGMNPAFEKMLKTREIVAEVLGVTKNPSAMSVASTINNKLDKSLSLSDIKKWVVEHKKEVQTMYDSAVSNKKPRKSKK